MNAAGQFEKGDQVTHWSQTGQGVVMEAEPDPYTGERIYHVAWTPGGPWVPYRAHHYLRLAGVQQ